MFFVKVTGDYRDGAGSLQQQETCRGFGGMANTPGGSSLIQLHSITSSCHCDIMLWGAHSLRKRDEFLFGAGFCGKTWKAADLELRLEGAVATNVLGFREAAL